MKKILLTVFTAIFAFAAATAQLNGIVVESSSDGSIGNCATGTQPAGTTTYRIYAELQDPTDFFVAVSANEGAVAGVPFQCHPLDISTTTTFYNNSLGSGIGDNINAALCGFLPEVGFDSWITIGNQDNTPGQGPTGSNWTNPLDPIGPACSTIPGASLTAEDGAWFALPGNANGFPVGPNNRVLLGQFTTDGDFSFNLNVSVLDEGVGGTSLFYPWNGVSGCINLLNYQDVTGLGLTFPVLALPGCTDVAACNFDATATEDDGTCTFADPGFDCAGNCLAGVPLVIDILADEFPGENAWTLTEDGVGVIASGDGTTQTVTICADAANCYIFEMTDSFGDGQEGSAFGGVDGSTSITLDGVEVFTSTGNWGDAISGFIGTCAPGCTDAAACNFDATALVDDGSCTFAEPGLDCAGNCLAGVPLVIDIIGDAYAGENAWTLTEDGVGVIASGDGFTQTVTVCVDAANCYTFEMTDSFGDGQAGDGGEGSEGATTITLEGTEVFSSSGDWGASISGTIGTCIVSGCTDIAALNYDATATVDDGSCIVPGCADAPVNSVYCYDTGVVSFTWEETTPGAGVIISINAGTFEICCDALFIYDGADNTAPILYDGTGVFNVAGVVAASTGSSITIEFNGDISVDCASGARVATDYDVYCGTINGCTDIAAANYDPTALTDDGSCTFDVLGCTDAGALNFDPAATLDDSSCILPGCADAPVNLTYCYDSFESTSFVFTEAVLGTGVSIVFNAGTFEVNFDDITVYDGVDNTAPVIGSFDGDVSGLVFQSTGASLTIEINSDSSVSCASGSEIALDYDVYCANVILGCTDVTACNYDAAAVGDDGSCDFSCFGCTDVAAVNYDPAATIDDGSCVFSTLNDIPALATPVALNTFNGPGAGCTGITGEDISAATVVAPEGDYRQTNPDLWYSFVPLTPGNSIQVTTSDFDALIEVFDAGLNLVTEAQGATFEDDNFVDGSEVFNTTDLVAGDTYYVRVAPFFAVTGPAIFDICIQRMRDSACDYGVGPYSLCGTFKADFVYADAYIFNFTSQTSGLTYTSNPQTSTFLTLSNVPGLLDGDMYDVEIGSLYSVIDGNGNEEDVIVSSDAPCQVDINETPLINLRASDNSVNFGPHFPGNYIRSNTFVCGASAYTWRFTRTDIPLLPVEFTTASSSTVVRISDALGLAVANDGGVYNVEVKPVFANGSLTDYGAVDNITIIGAAGVQGDVIVANDNMSEDALRADELVVSPSAMIYPNPSTGDAITLNLNDVAADVEVALITVTDFVGRTVASQQITISGAQHQEVLNLNNLASGTYLINVNMNGKILTEKLIIAK